MTLNNLLASPGFAAWLEGEPLDIGQPAAHARGQAARGHLLHRAPQRRRAHVLRLAPAQPDARLDAHAVRHHQPARAALHGRDLRLLPAGGEPAVEDAAADAAQAGPRLRPGRGARHAEPGGPRLQGALQHRHLVHRPAADRARQGARARRPRRRGGRRGKASTAAELERILSGLWQPRLPDEQRARGPPRGLPDPLGHVLSARAADAQPDQDADGSAARRRRRARPPRARPLPPRAVARPPPRRPRPRVEGASGRSCRPTSLSISSRCVAPRPRDRRSSTGPCSSGRPRSGWPTPRARWT